MRSLLRRSSALFRRASPIFVAMLFLVGCDALSDIEGLFLEPSGTCDDAGPLLPPSCDDEPALCGHPSLLLFSGGAPRFHIAFVPDGFDDEHLASFRRQAHALTDALVADVHGVVGRRPDLFRFSIVLAPSQTGDVVNGNRSDTLLGGCLESDGFGFGEPMLRVDPARAAFVADDALDDVDVVVAILRTGYGRANATSRTSEITTDATVPDRPWIFADNFRGSINVDVGHAIVKLNALSDAHTLDHELAHAVIGLADEYSDIDACFVPSFTVSSLPGGLPDRPNLTLDPSGAKWAHVVTGAEEGGDRFSSCVHHPPGPCRMKESATESYCAVCDHTIDKTYRALDGEQDGSPLCVLSSNAASMDTTNDFAFLGVDVQDGNVPSRAFLVIDDTVVYGVTGHSPSTAWGGYFLEPERLWAGDVDARLYCEDAKGGLAEARLTIPAHTRAEP